jgi:hypothetical protein
VVILDSSGTVLYEPMNIKTVEDIPQILVLSPDGQTLIFRPYNTDTRVYENQVSSIGADTSLTYIPDEEIKRFSLLWGGWQWIFPDAFDLVEFPDSFG